MLEEIPEQVREIVSELEKRIDEHNNELSRKKLSKRTKLILITERKTYKSILNIIYGKFPELRNY